MRVSSRPVVKRPRGLPSHRLLVGRQGSALWRHLVEEFPEAVLFTRSSDVRIVVGNRAASSILGTDVAGQIATEAGIRFRSATGGPLTPAEHPLLGPLMGYPEIRSRDMKLDVSEQRTIDVSVSASPVYSNEGELLGSLASFHDITEKKDLDRLREEFLLVAGHELRTPLTSLKGWTQYAQRRLARGEAEDTGGILSNLDRQITRIQALVDQLLDTSSMGRRDMPIEALQFDFAASVRDVLQMLPPEWASRVKFSRTNSVELKGDMARLERVVLNLLTNALKYSAPELPVRIRMLVGGDRLLVAICDRGIGIPKQDLPHIFEHFYRARNASHTAGLGLGLQIARNIVQRHGGELIVRSVEDRGTMFGVILPLAPLEPKQQVFPDPFAPSRRIS